MSGLAYQDLSPDTQERFAVQHFIDPIKDHDEAISLPCKLEALSLFNGN